MTDLILQNLKDFFGENRLTQVFCIEKMKMFGEQNSQVKRRKTNQLGSRPFAGSIQTLKKPGRRNGRI
jgi:hypothetical protein